MAVGHLREEGFKEDIMARNLKPDCRQCRRIGEKLFLKGMRCYSEKCAIDKKRGVPGISKRRRGKLSDFGLQLNEKQKVKKMYGMMEGQFRKYYEKASMMNGVTGHNLLKLLETRLDNVVYRAGFASSRAQARQIVRHGQILMNGREVNIPSVHVKVGDSIEIKEKFRQNSFLKSAIETSSVGNIPEWLQVDHEHYKVVIGREPERTDVSDTINEKSIVEFYSK
jgi:small subunit ribosomal protein S4